MGTKREQFEQIVETKKNVSFFLIRRLVKCKKNLWAAKLFETKKFAFKINVGTIDRKKISQEKLWHAKKKKLFEDILSQLMCRQRKKINKWTNNFWIKKNNYWNKFLYNARAVEKQVNREKISKKRQTLPDDQQQAWRLVAGRTTHDDQQAEQKRSTICRQTKKFKI